MTGVNSRGLVPSELHKQDRARDLAKVAEMCEFLERRAGRVWTVALRDEWNSILLRQGAFSAETLERALHGSKKGDHDDND
jgi:hypothetical protein